MKISEVANSIRRSPQDWGYTGTNTLRHTSGVEILVAGGFWFYHIYNTPLTFSFLQKLSLHYAIKGWRQQVDITSND